ncbi:hypothetical protein T4A_2785 [Trichinella pseudospiralis]|uniref:Uncharacterized protein n=1 Tax=Trichinella pseudospiralis TaxID=6337 RepID=A0A0V1ETC5_TRIPS|nr:hypothetical protein T4A_2785 [Trichinella pseudospiralis]
MRGSKGPFLCFLLIPSHFGKISHQGDCGGANIRSGICISSFEDAYDGFPYCQAVQVTQCLMPKRLCSSLYGADLLALGEASRAREMLSMRMNGTKANKPQEAGESPLMCLLLIPSHFGKISHQGDCGGANICSYTFCLSHDILGRGISVVLMYTPVLFAYLITFWDVTWGIAVVLMSTPVLSLNPVTFWDNKSTGGMWGGDATSSLLSYPITFWDRVRGGKCPLLCFLLIPSHFGKISHQGDCGGANIRSGTFC